MTRIVFLALSPMYTSKRRCTGVILANYSPVKLYAEAPLFALRENIFGVCRRNHGAPLPIELRPRLHSYYSEYTFADNGGGQEDSQVCPGMCPDTPTGEVDGGSLTPGSGEEGDRQAGWPSKGESGQGRDHAKGEREGSCARHCPRSVSADKPAGAQVAQSLLANEPAVHSPQMPSSLFFAANEALVSRRSQSTTIDIKRLTR